MDNLKLIYCDLFTWFASGADVGNTILFWTAPILTIRGLRSCSSLTSNLYPASSKFPSSANLNAAPGSSNLLSRKKRNIHFDYIQLGTFFNQARKSENFILLTAIYGSVNSKHTHPLPIPGHFLANRLK